MTLTVDAVGLNIQRRFVVTGFEARQVPRNVRTLASDRAARRRPAVKGDVIDFNYGGKNQKLFEGITVADARWLSERFKGLSDEQLKDAFRAANYTAEEVDMLTAALKARIAALENPAGAVAKDN